MGHPPIGIRSLDLFLLLIILAVGAFLRFDTLNEISLGNDELSALTRTKFGSFGKMIEKGVLPDFHPALVQTFLYFYTGLVGTSSDLLIRLPFAIAGTLALLFAFRLGRVYGGTFSGLLLAAFLATAAFPVLYSRTARPYAFGLLFILMFAYYWTRFLRAGDRREEVKWMPLFILSGVLCMLTHYFCGLSAILLGIIGFFKLSRRAFRNYLLSALGTFLLFAPHLGISYHHFSKGGVGGTEGWLGAPEPSFFLEHILHLFNGSPFLLGGVFFLLGIGIFWNGKPSFCRLPWEMLLAFALPLLIGYCYSIWVNPVLQHSILLFSMPFFFLFLFSTVRDRGRVKFRSLLVLLLGVGVGVHTIYGVWYYQTPTNGNFKEIAKIYGRFHQELGKERITRAASFNDGAYLEHYLDRYHPGLSAPELSKIRFEEQFGSFLSLVEKARTPYFLFSWAASPNRPYYREAIREKYPHVVEDHKFFNSGITLYSKKGKDRRKRLLMLTEPFTDTGSLKVSKAGPLGRTHYRSPPSACKIPSDRRYGPGFQIELDQRTDRDGSIWVKGTAWIRSERPLEKLTLVISYKARDSTYLWRSSSKELLQRTRQGSWNKLYSVGVIRREMPRGGSLKFYLWNRGKRPFQVDDMKLELMPWWDMNVVSEYLEYQRRMKKGG
ncbi:MAG: glycosyltransferase family 39 protein [Flavobacteriales bacterium]